MTPDQIVRQLLEEVEDNLDPEEIMHVSTFRDRLGPQAQEIYEIAPEKFKEAVAKGEKAEWDPDVGYVETTDWPVYYDDSGWDTHSFVSSYETPGDHTIHIVINEVDSDGDANFSDSAQLDSPEYDHLVREFSHGQWLRMMQVYMEWVAEYGADPANQFIAPAPPQPTEKWKVGFVEDNGRPKFVKARKILNEPPSPPPVEDLAQIPPHVRQWAMLDDEGYIQEMTWDEFQQLDDIVERNGIWVSTVSDLPAPGDPQAQENIGEFYRQKAREYLANWKEPGPDDYGVPAWS